MKKTKVVLASGVEKDIPANDLKKIVRLLEKMANDGTLLSNSEPVEMEKLSREEPKMYRLILKREHDFKKKEKK